MNANVLSSERLQAQLNAAYNKGRDDAHFARDVMARAVIPAYTIAQSQAWETAFGDRIYGDEEKSDAKAWFDMGYRAGTQQPAVLQR